MVALLIGMLVCVGLALAVVALVAIPARRDGRDILTPKGDDVVTALKERQQSARQRFARDDEPEGGETARDADAAVAEPTHADAAVVEPTHADAAVVEPTHADAGARS